jgi:hypothetical protein
VRALAHPTIARSGLRFGVLFVALSLGAMLVLVAGLAMVAGHAVAAGIAVAVIGFALLIGVSMYAAAAGMYMRTILYRYATNQPIPDLGVDVGKAFRDW